MKLPLIVAIALLNVAFAAFAQNSYPNKPVRMIVPFPAGFASDFLARTVGQKLGEIYGQQFVIDNRPGAGGIVGSTLISKAVPDGYTLAMIGQPHLVNALLQKEPPYRALEDITTIAEVAALPNVLVISPSLQVKSVGDLIALAKSKPGQLNMGSGGIGSSSHVAGELFRSAARIDVVHVPFKLLSDIVAEMVAGRVHFYVFPLPAIMPTLRDGRLKALATGTSKRIAAFPDLPTIAESGLPGFKTESWFGVVAPAQLPRSIVTQLNKDIVNILKQPDTIEKFQRQGADAVIGTPEDFQKLMRAEFTKYQKMVKDAGISAQ